MTKKVRTIILAVMLVLMLFVGYYLQVGMLFITGGSQEYFRIAYTLGFSLFYLLCWTLLFIFGAKKNSKILLILYALFWFAGPLFMVIEILIPSPMHTVPLWWLVFVAPLAGFGYFWSGITGHYDSIVVVVSVLMLSLGFIIKQNYRQNDTGKG